MLSPEEIRHLPKKGNLEMTLQDHIFIGSDPVDSLKENPGKTKGELMSDDEIQVYLRGEVDLINMLKSHPGNSFAESAARNREEDLGLSKDYLRRIGRLPKEFDDPGSRTAF